MAISKAGSRAGIIGAVVGIPSAALAVFLSLAQPYEGLRLTAYWDPYGKVWTVCYGETKNVHKGDHYTKAQCEAMLQKHIAEDYDPYVMAALNKPVPDKARGSFDDVAYNIGVGGFQKSSMVRLWNEGSRSAACRAMDLYIKAGGKTLRGLVLRRADEVKKCLEGVAGK